MKIFIYLKSGSYQAWRSRQGILIVWLAFFLLVLVFIYPLRGSLRSAFGSSMITERLAGGLDIEVFTDLGPTLKTILSSVTGGFIMVYVVGFLLNAFFTAGLFGSVRKETGKFSALEFFRAGSKNFWPFLFISLVITITFNFVTGVVLGIPMGVVILSETMPETSRFAVVISAGAVVLLLVPVFLLAADYSRAWKSTHENESFLKAIGFGFSRTFSKFWSSYIMMVLVILAQSALGILIMIILPAWKPVTGGGVFLLLIVSQLLFFARLLLKTWRYASVTSMMEETALTIPVNTYNINDEQGRSNQIPG